MQRMLTPRPWMRAAAVVLACVAAALAADETRREVVVAADGAGQFTSVAAAIESVKDASRERPVDIRIRPGTYDETITTKDWVNLVGDRREDCILRYDGGPEDTVRKHTIWVTSNTAIRNLTLVGLQVKYVIHSDGGRPYTLTIENCTLRREYPNAKARAYPAAFGIGLHADQHIVMKDCLLDADLPIYMHNWNNQSKPVSMTLERCTLKGADYALRIFLLGSKQRDVFVIHDSVLQAAKAGVVYANARNIKTTTWHGEDEIELYGSGNTMGVVEGAQIKDDSQERLSGLERIRRAP